MIKIKDITSLIEEFAPLSFQDNFDNSGLLVGCGDDTVTGALFCVDATETVVDEAIVKGINLVVSHHPVIFSPLRKLQGENYVERTVIKAIKNGVALYCAHTNLDSAVDGLSFRMAQMLGVQSTGILSVRGDNFGYGAIGTLEKELPLSEFLQKIKNTFNTQVIRYSNPVSMSVKKIATCSGSGGSALNDALRAGADILVTADLRYNTFFDAQKSITIVDIGHFESEYCSIDILYDIVTKKMPKFAACKSECSVNPINYFI